MSAVSVSQEPRPQLTNHFTASRRYEVAILMALPRLSDGRRCTSSLTRFGSRCTKRYPRRRNLQPPRPEPRSAADNSNVQVIVEIEAKAATVERLFMISERQEWTFGETLEYALDALELALAKMATG